MKPSHVDDSMGIPSCRHCGGEVGDDGYALSILEADSDSPLEEIDEHQSSTEEMNGFADAVSRHRYAGGGEVDDDLVSAGEYSKPRSEMTAADYETDRMTKENKYKLSRPAGKPLDAAGIAAIDKEGEAYDKAQEDKDRFAGKIPDREPARNMAGAYPGSLNRRRLGRR